MNGRPTAPDRMRRVLAVVPWIVANPGQKVAHVATRFGLSEKELLGDLNVVFMVGLPPYSPDALVDVQIDDEGRVTIQLADFLSRPLRLPPEQGLALLASSDGLLSIPGTDPEGALARALKKLGQALGVGADEALEVHLGDAEATMLDQLREAARSGREANLVYYSYGRDERTERTVDPWRVFADAGSWYLNAWCHRARGERIFRLDRIERLEVLDSLAANRPVDGGDRAVVFQPRDDDPRITVALSPEAFWVADYYPVEVLSRSATEMVVDIVVSAVPWLERLLIRLGPEVEVRGSEGLEDATDLARETASRILTKYRSG
ncbi:MAG: WYL domain-containing protein [Actinomycetia bacterium]|nr:WYL domain-containing protein [Actinomycetes bacterium]